MGTPKRCADPTAMSAPISPTGLNNTDASRSVQDTTRVSDLCTSVMKCVQSLMTPEAVGYCTITPQYSPFEKSAVSATPTSTVNPKASPRVLARAIF